MCLFESQVVDVLVKLAKSLVFNPEKTHQRLSYYWPRAHWSGRGYWRRLYSGLGSSNSAGF